ncbi:YrhB domain-containing protein [Streptomyces sp. NPDC020330]|uniref:YrhB domain-containing protein n=1 Tax=unclassified Streptomyces TaxID=2593676 RepID=UPI0037B70B3F
MIERDAAVRTVEEELERDYQRQLSAGLNPMRMAVSDVERHELVWIVFWTSEEYLRTRDPNLMLAGNGPYLVDRVDGSLHWIGVVASVTDAWEADYRSRIRGQTTRTAVDELHDEVRAVAEARGRIHAMHTLRRSVPTLSLAQTVEYVTALQRGDAPAHLAELATGELVPPTDPFLSVTTIRGAEHGPQRAVDVSTPPGPAPRRTGGCPGTAPRPASGPP